VSDAPASAPAASSGFPLPALAEGDRRQVLALLEREPTPTEIRVIDVAWSEHCSYRSSRHLLATLPTHAPHVVIGPGEDAGVVSLGAEVSVGGVPLYAVIAHESHNHPSQLLPVEGAATGVGGIVRDVYCMGADVIGVLNALRFGALRGPGSEETRGLVHGVVRGIGLYGNALGVPTLGGDIDFDRSFAANCLVNVVAVGVVPADCVIHSRIPPEAREEPYVLVLVGKATDATGLGGASFASAVLDGTFESASAVQVPDPFVKRVLTEAMKVALADCRANNVTIGAKDLGAGGLATAASELAAKGGFGCDVDLTRVPLAMRDLSPDVIACAETQERYIFAVPARGAAGFCATFNETFELGRMSPGAAATVIGAPRPDGRVVFRWRGEVVCDLAADALTAAPPTPPVRARRPAPEIAEPGARTLVVPDWDGAILGVLAHPSVASRRKLYERLDGDVQGRTVLRRGTGDAGVVRVHPELPAGIALSVDGASRVGRLDAYAGAVLAVAEAMRNVACVGAIPWTLTDCLNFGSPMDMFVAEDLARAVEGLADAARALFLYESDGLPVPFVSGNVSLYNQSADGRAVAPSPIVACLGLVANVAGVAGSSLARDNGALIHLGSPVPALGASAYADVAQIVRGDPPLLDLDAERRLQHCVITLIRAHLVSAAHDVSAGGLAACVAEMLMPANAGCSLDLGPLVAQHGEAVALFAEAGGVVVESADEDVARVLETADRAGVPALVLGHATTEARVVLCTGERVRATFPLDALRAAYEGGLDAFGL
jgi:phosphoribosylformylglycinamidine synthase